MSRTVEISLPQEKTDETIQKISQLDGLISLRVQKDISLNPKGDVIAFELTNDAVSDLLKILENQNLLYNDDVYISTSRPVSVLSTTSSSKITTEGNESSWEEILTGLNHESNMTLNGRIIMFISGFIAAIGISTNSLHIVIGAMVIAPGFKPISRMVLGLITQHRDWRHGFNDTLRAYASLIVGSLGGALFIKILGNEVIPGTSSYLPAGVLVDYWSSITPTSLIVSVFASVAGGIILMTNKSVLTAGVMIALALIPAASLIGMGIVEAKWEIAGMAFLRLILEIAIVIIFSGIIFLWKRLTKHKRRMMA